MDIFHIQEGNLTFTNQIKHVIGMKDEIPVYAERYIYPEMYKKEVNSQIQDILKQSIIQTSKSQWNSPIWIVLKKADALRKQKFRLGIGKDLEY